MQFGVLLAGAWYGVEVVSEATRDELRERHAALARRASTLGPNAARAFSAGADVATMFRDESSLDYFQGIARILLIILSIILLALTTMGR